MAKRAASAKAKKAAAAKPESGESDAKQHVIDVTMRLAAERGWRELALADIAAAADMSLAELYALYRSKQAILAAFLRDVDMAVLEETEPTEGPAKDRLFDVLMRRLDKLEPYKPALQRIAEDTARDPLQLVCGVARLDRSMAAMLEAAGISAGGLTGILRIKALEAIYLSALRTWFRDDSPDKSRTMAALDRGLTRAERLVGGARRWSRRSAAA
jgi:AcrR family transcriptional regulator